MFDNISTLIIQESEGHFEYLKYAYVFENVIKMELDYLNEDRLVKIVDFRGNKDDGVYLGLKDGCQMHIVEKSFRNTKSLRRDDFVALMAYSLIVRVLCYNEKTPFEAIRFFTKKIDVIIDRYNKSENS